MQVTLIIFGVIVGVALDVVVTRCLAVTLVLYMPVIFLLVMYMPRCALVIGIGELVVLDQANRPTCKTNRYKDTPVPSFIRLFNKNVVRSSLNPDAV